MQVLTTAPSPSPHRWENPWPTEHGTHMFSRIPSTALAVPCSVWLASVKAQPPTGESQRSYTADGR
jgi:hypothetical protein